MIGTTVLCIRKEGKVCYVALSSLLTQVDVALSSWLIAVVCLQVVIIADGQVTMGGEVVKPNVKKVRRIGKDVIAGFAGPPRAHERCAVCAGDSKVAWEGGSRPELCLHTTLSRRSDRGRVHPLREARGEARGELGPPAFPPLVHRAASRTVLLLSADE